MEESLLCARRSDMEESLLCARRLDMEESLLCATRSDMEESDEQENCMTRLRVGVRKAEVGAESDLNFFTPTNLKFQREPEAFEEFHVLFHVS